MNRNLSRRPPRTQGRTLTIVRQSAASSDASPTPAAPRPADVLDDFVAHFERAAARSERSLLDVFRGLDYLSAREALLSPEDEAALERCFAAFRASRRAIDAMEEAQLHAIRLEGGRA